MASYKEFPSGAMRLAPRVQVTGVPPGGTPGWTLENIATFTLADGCLCWVIESQADFRFLASSTLAPDGVDIIAPIAGPGRWIKTDSALGDCEPLSRELWVDAGTDVPVGLQDGSICAPFSTIGAAITAGAAVAAGPLTVRVAAGTYVERVALPIRDDFALIGSGETQTIIQGPVGVANVVFWAPTAPQGATINEFEMRNLTIRTVDVAQEGLSIVSSTISPDTMLGGSGALIDHVTIDGPGVVSIELTRIGRARIQDCTATGSLVSLNCSTPRVQRSVFTNCDVSWNAADAGGVPGSGIGDFVLEDSSVITVDLVPRQQARLVVGETVRIGNNVTGVGLSGSGGIGPNISCAARIVGSVSLQYPDLAGLTVGCNFNECEVLGGVTFDVAGGVTVLNATIRDALVTGSITTGAGIVNVDARGSRYGSLVGGGTFDRDQVTILAADLAADPAVVAIAPAFPAAVGGSYAVAMSLTAGTAVVWAVTAKAAGSVTIDFAAGEGGRTGDITITRLTT